MKFGFVDEHREVWPVRMMCSVLGLSASGYYAWRDRPESPRAAANRALLDDIRLIHAESSGTYGSPRVQAVLRGHGRRVGRTRIERLMRRAGIRGLAAQPRRTRTTDSRHGYPIAPNRLGRNFAAARPNQVWLADLTYIPTGEGWLYLAGILDMHTRKLVGWSMRETLHTEIALDALSMAVQRQRPAPGLIHHSDRGIQYAAEAYRGALARSGITPSMSRKGDCRDNAPMESFFTPSRPSGSTTGFTPRAPRPGGICSATSKASTTHAACTRPWTISAQPRWSAERLNLVHFAGGDQPATNGSNQTFSSSPGRRLPIHNPLQAITARSSPANFYQSLICQSSARPFRGRRLQCATVAMLRNRACWASANSVVRIGAQASAAGRQTNFGCADCARPLRQTCRLAPSASAAAPF